MKTDDFISMLASGAAPVERHALAKRFCIAVLLGLATSIVLVMVIFGVRSDLSVVATTPLFWAKIAFPLCLMVGALGGGDAIGQTRGHAWRGKTTDLCRRRGGLGGGHLRLDSNRA